MLRNYVLHEGSPSGVFLTTPGVPHCFSEAARLCLAERSRGSQSGFVADEVRAHVPGLVKNALARNLEVQVVNYPAGQHGFDVFDDTDTSRAIIRQAIEFLRLHTSTREQDLRQ